MECLYLYTTVNETINKILKDEQFDNLTFSRHNQRGNCRNSDVSNISAIGGIDIGGITYIGGIDGMTIQRRPRHTYSLSDKRRE